MQGIQVPHSSCFYLVTLRLADMRCCWYSVGMAMAGIELTLDWVKQRQAFGKTLWDIGAIRQRLSMAASEVEASRQLLWHAAWLDSQGQDCVREVSMVKALTGEMVNKVLYDCTQFFGGMGFMRENPVERLYRDARVMGPVRESQAVVGRLFDAYIAEGDMPGRWGLAYSAASSDPAKARIVCDFVAGMTDPFALEEHKRLFDERPEFR